MKTTTQKSHASRLCKFACILRKERSTCLHVQPVASLALNGEQLRKAQQQSSANLWQPDVAAGLLLMCRPESGKRCEFMSVASAAPCTLIVAMLKLNTCCLVVATCSCLSIPSATAGHDRPDISCIFSKKRTEYRKEGADSCGPPQNLCVHACVQEQQLHLRCWLMLSSGRRQCTWERLAWLMAVPNKHCWYHSMPVHVLQLHCAAQHTFICTATLQVAALQVQQTLTMKNTPAALQSSHSLLLLSMS